MRQWLFLAKQAEAERFNRRTLIVRDPVLFVRCVRDSEVTPHALWDRRKPVWRVILSQRRDRRAG